MFLAAKEAIGYVTLVLPYSTKPFLNNQRIIELANLLEFVNTNNEVNTLLLGNHLWKLQYLFRLIVLWRNTQRQRNFIP